MSVVLWSVAVAVAMWLLASLCLWLWCLRCDGRWVGRDDSFFAQVMAEAVRSAGGAEVSSVPRYERGSKRDALTLWEEGRCPCCEAEGGADQCKACGWGG